MTTNSYSIKKALVAAVACALLVLGVTGSAGAIVGGSQAAVGAHPYQVSLQSGGEHYCGGSIVDATTIVTAAHCVEGETAAGTTIRAGVIDVTSSRGQDVQVASITSHPKYAQRELADIAVIKLAEPLTLGGNVQAIPLATAAQVEAAGTATVSGWGAVSENGGSSDQLLEAQVGLVSDAACALSLGTDGPTEVCAGGTGTDSCYGDSGGPLVVQTASGPALAGVVSWGEECGGATPGVYADVPGLTDWVNSVRDGAPADVETGDEAANDEDFADDEVAAEDFGYEDFADDEVAAEDFGYEDFADDEFAAEDFGYEDFAGDEFADEDFEEYEGDYDDLADADVDYHEALWGEDLWEDDFYGDDDSWGEDLWEDDFYGDDDSWGEDLWEDDFYGDDEALWGEDLWEDDFYGDDDSWDEDYDW